MKRNLPPVLLLSLAALVLVGPGCSTTELKNTNRRLKEANDRLVSENNRLEQELAAAEKDVAEKAKRIDSLQSDLEQSKTAAPSPAEEPRDRLPPPAIDGDLGDLNGQGIEVRRSPQGIHLRLKDQVFFSTGRATLSPKGQAILKTVAQKLNSKYRGQMIRVEGHTDDVPVNKVKNIYPSNWELSTARACTVVRYLVDHASMKPTRIYPAGFAYYKPVVASKTPSARSQNRRVEVVILNERV
jgi:chemotaxis protein MotB